MCEQCDYIPTWTCWLFPIAKSLPIRKGQYVWTHYWCSWRSIMNINILCTNVNKRQVLNLVRAHLNSTSTFMKYTAKQIQSLTCTHWVLSQPLSLGYSQQWKKEKKKSQILDIRHSPRAINCWLTGLPHSPSAQQVRLHQQHTNEKN